MSEFTPGPWTVEYELNVIGSDGLSVLGAQSNAPNTNMHERNKANARLIAAAPDMLDALQAVANSDVPMNDALDTVWAAIARATNG